MKNRYEWVDVLRGLAIVSVYLAHSILVYPIDMSQDAVLSKVLLFIEPFYMPLFFCISGYCHKQKNYLQNIKERTQRLLIPYFLFNLLTMLVKVVGAGVVNTKVNSVSEDVLDWLLYGGHYWFLYVLFMISLLTPITDLICKKVYGFMISVAGVILLGILFRDIEILCINRVLWYYLFYISGVAVKKWLPLNKVKAGFAFILIIPYVLGTLGAEYIDVNNYFINIVLAVMGICVLWSGATLLAKGKNIVKKFLILAGKYSLQFYLVNGYLLVCARVVLVQILEIQNIYLVYCLIVISNLIGALIFSVLADKIKIARWALGMKA